MPAGIVVHRAGLVRHGMGTGQAWPAECRVGTARRVSRVVPLWASCLAFGPSTTLRAAIHDVPAR